jgi:DNA-binding CsgD family transcriptional regulator
MKDKLYSSKEWLRLRYIVQHKSLQDMADEAKVSLNTIRTALKRAGYLR